MFVLSIILYSCEHPLFISRLEKMIVKKYEKYLMKNIFIFYYAFLCEYIDYNGVLKEPLELQ